MRSGELEKAIQDLLQGEVGPEELVVDIVSFLPQGFGYEGHVPRLQLLDAEGSGMGSELCQIPLPVGPRPIDEVFLEGHSPCPRFDHGILKAVVGEMPVSEDLGQCVAKGEDQGNEWKVVELVPPATAHIGPVDFLPEASVPGVLHDRFVGGEIQGEDPSILLPILGLFPESTQGAPGNSVQPGSDPSHEVNTLPWRPERSH